MKRTLIIGAATACAAIAVYSVGLATAEEGLCRGAHVLHEARTFLMEQPRRLGPRVAELGYGSVITAVGRAEGAPGWCRAEHEGQVGFVHVQSFTPGRVARSGSSEGSSAADRETVQLAARGFSPEVEERSRAENTDLDYDLVDAVAVTVPEPEKILLFAEDGRLLSEVSR